VRPECIPQRIESLLALHGILLLSTLPDYFVGIDSGYPVSLARWYGEHGSAWWDHINFGPGGRPNLQGPLMHMAHRFRVAFAACLAAVATIFPPTLPAQPADARLEQAEAVRRGHRPRGAEPPARQRVESQTVHLDGGVRAHDIRATISLLGFD
jgi:hypothetical protein